jgi:hypothetical protein
LFDLFFPNPIGVKSVRADSSLLQPHTYHSPFSTGVCFPHVNNNLNCELSYPILQLAVCFTTFRSVPVAVASLRAAVRDATERATPSANSLPVSLVSHGIALLRKIISTVVLKRSDRITFMTNFPSAESLLKQYQA